MIFIKRHATPVPSLCFQSKVTSSLSRLAIIPRCLFFLSQSRLERLRRRGDQFRPCEFGTVTRRFDEVIDRRFHVLRNAFAAFVALSEEHTRVYRAVLERLFHIAIASSCRPLLACINPK